MRSGTWAALKEGEKDLYIYLMEQSERYWGMVVSKLAVVNVDISTYRPDCN